MSDYEAMEIGDALPLTNLTEWNSITRHEYNKAQEITRRTGKMFEVETRFHPPPNEKAIAGFYIKRTR